MNRYDDYIDLFISASKRVNSTTKSRMFQLDPMNKNETLYLKSARLSDLLINYLKTVNDQDRLEVTELKMTISNLMLLQQQEAIDLMKGLRE